MNDITAASTTSLKEQYTNLMSKVDSMEPYLRLLYRDYLLITTREINFTYAVDFHEIWNYAEPIAKLMQVESKGGPSSGENTIEGQVARAELFFGLGSNSHCVLLPPYVIELNNKIAHVKARLLHKGSLDNNDFLRKLEKFAGEDVIRNAMREFGKDKKVQSALLRDLQLFLENNVKELLFLISGAARQGLNIIQDLLSGDKPRVQMSSSRWPKMNTLIKQIMEMAPSKWYVHFNKIRPNPESASSNLYDSKAIDLVLALNEQLIEKGEMVVIVSAAPTMERALKQSPADKPTNYIWTASDGICIQIPGFAAPVSIFRPIEIFYYLTMFQAPTDEETLRNLSLELDRIDQIHMLGESLKELLTKCNRCAGGGKIEECIFADGCRNIRIKQQISEHNEYFNQYKNVLLAENRFSILKPAWERVVAQQREFEKKLSENSLSLIEYLSLQRHNLESGFKHREQQLINSMEEELKEALYTITDLSSSYQDDISDSLDKFTRTNYRIRFSDKKIADSLNELEQSRSAGNIKMTSQAIKQLIGRAYEKSLGPERPLLWAVLLLCHRLPDRTIRLVNRTLPDVPKEYKPEYLYVLALAHYIHKEFAQVINDCKANISKYKNDPRFYHLCGLAISKQIDPIDSRGHSWSEAIEYARKAHILVEKYGKDVDLQGTIANNLAYFHCRRNAPGDLEKALDYVNELKHLIPTFEKPPEFLHTIGCVFKGLALKEKDETVRKQYKEEALNNFGQALQLAKNAKVEQSEIDEYEKELRKAEQQLGSIKPVK